MNIVHVSIVLVTGSVGPQVVALLQQPACLSMEC